MKCTYPDCDCGIQGCGLPTPPEPERIEIRGIILRIVIKGDDMIVRRASFKSRRQLYLFMVWEEIYYRGEIQHTMILWDTSRLNPWWDRMRLRYSIKWKPPSWYASWGSWFYSDTRKIFYNEKNYHPHRTTICGLEIYDWSCK